MPTPPLSEADLKTTYEKWLECGKDYRATSRKMSMSDSAVKRRVQQAIKKFGGEAQKSTGKSLAEFRATHDKNFIIPKRIKEGLAKLGESWEYEMAFTKIAGVSLGDLAAFRAMFDEHVVLLDRGSKRAWAGTKAFAEKMREMVGP